ncbi:3-hydroxyacyl-CoA dehydrogenase/enoyl-CoA hydratase family protein [Deinococcus cellulosilyticus]|uniref:3-hydroxyacyl-CoA dehydrogenase n=1 Tax=Deinococcus cellulosilyticus (strain DSM 18568 / NBRC 106333 / KACC 11606 / 5516J-15) TaxID=1223518 RepID=A0A511N7Z2_DEIC1|nr:3-hydroxyacyl-CoA dehydrogenase/enoyl-CoA hydratase family protein [Deinococcus cellulosilyticus]GEM48953.1 3-hydroxyacyl-CoA dehydrogenase [Deinococcus cellulosilyticus NBRC 106333 = KACC 11606]
MKVKTAAVIGAGTMGAAIAAHLANAGIPTLLLDIVLPDQKDRNFLAKQGLDRALKASPAAFMDKDRAKLIRIGNLEDNLKDLANVDWVVEAIIEKLDAKKALWEKLDGLVKPTTIVSSNSSGIPMHLQIEGRSDAFKRQFVGTHFFNPPRYLHLLEVIPTPSTDPDVVKTISEFGDKVLGKGIVNANDVPGFVANRIGVYGMVRTLKHMQDTGISIDEVDALTGPIMGRPKSATMRTADLTGLDVLFHVAGDLQKATPEDEDFTLTPMFLQMIEQKRLGDKTGQGFYKKVKENGKSVILTLDPETMEYVNKGKTRLAELEPIKGQPLPERIKGLTQLPGKYGEFMRKVMMDTFWYAAKMAGNVSNTIVDIDNALKWGFGWEMGPFETMDALGVQNVISYLEKEGRTLPPLLQAMKDSGRTSFYQDGEVVDVKGQPEKYEAPYMILKDLKKDATRVVKSRPGASLVDIGDGVLLLEFHSKMNSLGEDAINMVFTAHKIIEEQGFVGLVMGNQGDNFSAGANLPLILMNAQNGDWDEIDMAIRQFQRATTSLRFSPHPTVVAPFNLTLGGGCEFSLHGDHTQASAETYMGLVEVGVGLLPGGGGTKEMYLRFVDELPANAPLLPALQRAFETIALAKTSTSALEAKKLGYLRDSDGISMNRDRLIQDAKAKVLELARNYVAPTPRQDIPVMGENGYAAIRSALYGMVEGGFASEHDQEVSLAVARVLCGGRTNNRNARVSEQFLLDLERENFLYLCGKRKTQERIAHMLKTGKPLRN